MTVLNFIFSVILLIIVLIMFICWLGAKYDVVGRNEENKILREELKKQLEKEIRSKIKNQKIKRSERNEQDRRKQVQGRAFKNKS